MTAARYLLGLVLLVVALAPLGIAAYRIRARALDFLSGAEARAAESIIALALLFTILHVLGSVGAFRMGFVVAACAVVGLSLALLIRRSVAPTPVGSAIDRRHWSIPDVVALGITAAVAALWIAITIERLGQGVVEYDSLQYHMSFAGRFFQEGWITRLHYIAPEFPHMFHPASSELVHALGMLVFGRDVMSPFPMLGWFGVSLLGGWCLGRPYAREPMSMAAVATVFALPAMLRTQPAAASSDTAAIGLLLLATVFVLRPGSRLSVIFLAGLSAGLGASTRFTAMIGVAALTIVLPVCLERKMRLRGLGVWAGGLMTTGSFWYLRNLFRAGSPLPFADLPLFPTGRFRLIERWTFSLGSYLDDPDVLREWIWPQLRPNYSLLWPLLFAAVLSGIALAFLRGGRSIRTLGVVAVFSIFAYVVMPTSGYGLPGQPILFGANVRYAIFGLAVGLVLMVLMLRSTAALVACLTLLLAIVVASAMDSPHLRDVSARPIALTIGIVVIAGLAWAARDLIQGPLRWGAAAVVVVAVTVAGHGAQRVFLENRYREFPTTAWGSELSGKRIGVVNIAWPYLLYGEDLTNRVDYLARKGPHGEFSAARECDELRGLIEAGRYEYIVAQSPLVHADLDTEVYWRDYGFVPQALDWVRRIPGATEVGEDQDRYLFRYDPPPDATGCG